MGRFEIVRSTHWLYQECRDASGYSLENFLFFGGYSGGASLVGDEYRWLDYLNDSVIEPSISRDVISLEEVRKPELIEGCSIWGCGYGN